jgi:hypothetical protein
MVEQRQRRRIWYYVVSRETRGKPECWHSGKHLIGVIDGKIRTAKDDYGNPLGDPSIGILLELTPEGVRTIEGLLVPYNVKEADKEKFYHYRDRFVKSLEKQKMDREIKRISKLTLEEFKEELRNDPIQ